MNYFFCTDPCASRDLLEQITESSELDFARELPFIKNKLAQVSDTIEACYCNDQPETRIIINACKVFFFFFFFSELAC